MLKKAIEILSELKELLPGLITLAFLTMLIGLAVACLVEVVVGLAYGRVS
jgi:hypothetical protein